MTDKDEFAFRFSSVLIPREKGLLGFMVLDIVSSQMCHFVSQFLLLLWRLLLCLDTCSGWGILIYCDSPLVILSFFHFSSLFYRVLPLGGF